MTSNENRFEDCVLLIASPGGHLTQLLDIASKIGSYKIVVTTSDNGVTPDDWNGCTKIFDNTRYNIFLHLLNLIRSLGILIKFKPAMMISTGGPFALPMFLAARFMTVKSVYIDTASRITAPSATAGFLSRFNLADEIIVQWPHLTAKLKSAHYHGSIFNLPDDRNA